MSNKRGRMSRGERDFIRTNAHTMSVEKIAERISRTPEMVRAFIKENVPPAKAVTPTEAEQAERVIIRQELRTSEAWKNLKSEFTTDELRYFEEAYVKLMAQFKNEGVLASEETQIFQAIKFELLMSRNLRERKQARDDLVRYERQRQDFFAQYGDDPSGWSEQQRDFVMGLEGQMSEARGSEQSRTNEYVKLQERHESLLKALKAHRDQRVKQIESSKVNFLSVIKELQERDAQEREGRQMELMKLAGEVEYVRLGRPVKYDDDNEDSPILSAETVDLGPEEDVESPGEED